MYFCRISYVAAITVGLMAPTVFSFPKEPICSKYDYEEKLLEKMLRMEIKVEQMSEYMKRAKDVITEDMKKAKEDITEDMRKAKEDITTTSTEINEKMENMETNASKFQEVMEKKMKSYADEIKKESSKITTLGESLKIPSVAFNARRSSTIDLSTNDIIVFDVVILNEGGNYDSSTGIFTAPHAGLYYFAAQMCNYPGHTVYYTIVVEDDQISSSTHYDKDGYSCTSVNAVAMVNLNERVWIKATSNSKFHQDIYRWTSFLGALLHR